MCTLGGYHEYIGRCSGHRGFRYKSKAFMNLLSHMNHDVPRCTEHTFIQGGIWPIPRDHVFSKLAIM